MMGDRDEFLQDGMWRDVYRMRMRLDSQDEDLGNTSLKTKIIPDLQ